MSQTKQQNITRQLPVALLAIMQHAVDNNLSAPWSIDTSPGDQAIRVRLMGREHQVWIDTLTLLEEHNEETDQGPGMVRTSWHVQLPATGVVFDIVAYREVPFSAPSLSVVQA